jgi:hypothetical protein
VSVFCRGIPGVGPDAPREYTFRQGRIISKSEENAMRLLQQMFPNSLKIALERSPQIDGWDYYVLMEVSA